MQNIRNRKHYDAKHSDKEFPSEMMNEMPEKRYHLNL